MNMNRIYVLLLIGTMMSMTSCVVSKKKYEQEVAARESYEAKSLGLGRDLSRVKDTLNLTDQELASQRATVQNLKREIQQLQTDYANMQATNRRLQLNLNEINNQALSEREKMDAALQAKLLELERKEKIIDDLQANVAQREQAMKDILGKIEQAIAQYSSDDLSVEMKEGKVYIALSNALLFKSGSAAVDPKGKEALGTLAGVLSKNPDISILVEGHTDNVPIRSASFKDNWDLSVIRATSVVRLLTEEYQLSPSQVSAAGKGEFAPKSDNDTREGKAINRRIEIIIQPQLDEIYKLVKEG